MEWSRDTFQSNHSTWSCSAVSLSTTYHLYRLGRSNGVGIFPCSFIIPHHSQRSVVALEFRHQNSVPGFSGCCGSASSSFLAIFPEASIVCLRFFFTCVSSSYSHIVASRQITVCMRELYNSSLSLYCADRRPFPCRDVTCILEENTGSLWWRHVY